MRHERACLTVDCVGSAMTSSSGTSTPRSSTARSTRRTCGGSTSVAVAARWALDRGRWDDAARHALAVIGDPRESPWTYHQVLCVLALLRARRGDPGARDALVPGVRGRRPVSRSVSPTWTWRRPVQRSRGWSAPSSDVDAANDRDAVGGGRAGGRQGGCLPARLLAAARRPRGRWTHRRTTRGRTRLHSPADGREAAEEWTRRSCPYEAALALYTSAAWRPCGRRTASCGDSALARWRRSWPASYEGRGP